MIWEEFRLHAPKLAGLGEERFERSGLILLGTLRKNGWPRISPVEAYITDGHLYLGMMWQSLKALDLLRDPRCTVHSVVSKPDGSEGEFKVYGYARSTFAIPKCALASQTRSMRGLAGARRSRSFTCSR